MLNTKANSADKKGMSSYWINWVEGNLAPLAAAIVLGGLIGLERQIHKKPAGLRTNMTICLAAAVFTMLSGNLGGDGESRVIQGIITGVGFLGAGALIHTQGNIYGLTTAATIWLVTAVGIACGMGRYETAALTAVLTLIILWGLSPLDKRLKKTEQQ